MTFLHRLTSVLIPRPIRRVWWKLREHLSPTEFDESFYLAAYTDVAAAVSGGESFVTAFHHFKTTGLGEGREAIPSYRALSPAAVELIATPVEFPAPGPSTIAQESRSTGTTTVVNQVDLTEAHSIGLFYFELTTRCNLRCVYCPVSQPTYWNVDFTPERVDEIVDELVAHHVDVVQLNGHGESTIVKGWDVLADRLADQGLRLRIVTNLVKRLTPSELAALSRFEQIMFSIDSVDPDLCAQLRRGADLAKILDNVALIREHALARRRPLEIVVSAVVSDQSVSGLERLIETLLDQGVHGFRFGDLSEYPSLEGAMVTRHISSLPPEVLVEAGEGLRRGLKRIEEAGAWVEIDPPIVSLLLDREHSNVGEDVRAAEAGEKKVHFEPVPEGQTRDCLDPWSTAYLHATGAVRPCCFFETHLGAIIDHTLGDVLNGTAFRHLRQSLLDGELPPSCLSCNARGLIDRDGLRAKVETYLDNERHRIG